MKTVGSILGAVLSLCTSVACNAAVFEFDVLFISGPLAGSTFTGQVETTEGAGDKAPANGGLLGFEINIAGDNFGPLTDPLYPDSPKATVGPTGELVALSYVGMNDALTASFGFDFSYVPDSNFAIWSGGPDHPLGNEFSAGFITAIRGTAEVPDVGSGVLLFGLALVGLALTNRR